MISFDELRINTTGIRSLVWDGNDLVDWIDGGQRYQLDGTVVPRHVRYSEIFDAVTTSPGSDYVVIFSRLGTKGLILKQGHIVREINRSFYQSDVYEYPVALAKLENGREIIIHCPDEYNRLEIDDVVTGERLTTSSSRQPADFFHSRLTTNSDASLLASCGWIWHPLDDVRVFDIEAALRDPTLLDGSGRGSYAWAEESSATFLGKNKLAVALAGIEDDEGQVNEQRYDLRIFNLDGNGSMQTVALDQRAGTIIAVSEEYVLALYGFPRLIALANGETVARWPELSSGRQTSSIVTPEQKQCPTALDFTNRRIAIADETGVTVLRFQEH